MTTGTFPKRIERQARDDIEFSHSLVSEMLKEVEEMRERWPSVIKDRALLQGLIDEMMDRYADRMARWLILEYIESHPNDGPFVLKGFSEKVKKRLDIANRVI